MRKKGTEKNTKSQDKEFEEQLIEVRRVTRTVAGGRRLSFRATVVIGDKKGRVGMGIGKNPDVSTAISKAVNKAKKNLITVPINEQGSVPHFLEAKFKASKVRIRPAPEGSGLVVGGSIRALFELAGYRNVTAKILGSKSKINNLKAVLLAFRKIRKRDLKSSNNDK
ncbi:30S ribosomal protein S5 [bacterium]|nr:30S ribosomal protein S5 [bacterium]